MLGALDQIELIQKIHTLEMDLEQQKLYYWPDRIHTEDLSMKELYYKNFEEYLQKTLSLTNLLCV